MRYRLLRVHCILLTRCASDSWAVKFVEVCVKVELSRDTLVPCP